MNISITKFNRILFWTVIINFIAQIPYYIHQYYLVRHVAPSIMGVTLMTIVLAWFLIAYWLLKQGKRVGYLTMLSFLVVEFLFYLQTQLVQLASGSGILLHVLHPDGTVLFCVFLIGYINFAASVYFISYLIKHRKSYLQ